MTIQIGGYNFDGPYSNSQTLQARSGVYVVLGINGPQQYWVIDVGESRDVQNRLACHDREPWWRRQGSALFYAALYCDETHRMLVEQNLRRQYDPPCGHR